MMQNPANQRSNNDATQAMKQWFGLNLGGEGFKRRQQRLHAREISLKWTSPLRILTLSLSQPNLQKSEPLGFGYFLNFLFEF